MERIGRIELPSSAWKAEVMAFIRYPQIGRGQDTGSDPLRIEVVCTGFEPVLQA